MLFKRNMGGGGSMAVNRGRAAGSGYCISGDCAGCSRFSTVVSSGLSRGLGICHNIRSATHNHRAT